MVIYCKRLRMRVTAKDGTVHEVVDGRLYLNSKVTALELKKLFPDDHEVLNIKPFDEGVSDDTS